MKGLLFNELVEFAEDRFGCDVVARVEGTAAPYGAIASYPSADLVALATRLADAGSERLDVLLRAFGERLFGRFASLYPVFFVTADSTFEFLAQIDTTIHGEVEKLYPNAEFPRFKPTTEGADVMRLHYRSARPFADLAEGMLQGCITHFGESVDVRREPVTGPAGTAADFVLVRRRSDRRMGSLS